MEDGKKMEQLKAKWLTSIEALGMFSGGGYSLATLFGVVELVGGSIGIVLFLIWSVFRVKNIHLKNRLEDMERQKVEAEIKQIEMNTKNMETR